MKGRPIEWVVVNGEKVSKTVASKMLREAAVKERQAYRRVIQRYFDRPMVGPKRRPGNFSGHAAPMKAERNAEMAAYYLDRHTLQETGDEFGVTRQRVEQILRRMGVTERRTWAQPKPPRLTPEAKELRRRAKFWLYVDITVNPDECWLWTGGLDAKGHGWKRYNGMNLRAERIAYILTNGQPKGWVVQTCRNILCCNPGHLKDLSPAETCRKYRAPRRPDWVYRNEAVQ